MTRFLWPWSAGSNHGSVKPTVTSSAPQRRFPSIWSLLFPNFGTMASQGVRFQPKTHCFCWEQLLFFYYLMILLEIVREEEEVLKRTKSEEELEMEDVSVTFLFIWSFPSFPVQGSLALPPLGGELMNKRKILVLPLFQPALPCRPYQH